MQQIRRILKYNQTLYNLYWFHAFKNNHPGLYLDEQTNDLYFILGVARSGTTWIGNTLRRTDSSLRYLEEPLKAVKPPLYLSKKNDNVALPFAKNTFLDARFLTAYEAFCTSNFPYKTFFRNEYYNIYSQRNRIDKNSKITLVKEVHSLLGTEKILNNFKTKILFILRNPIYILDSQLSIGGQFSFYLNNEGRFILHPEFTKKFYPNLELFKKKLFKKINYETCSFKNYVNKLMTIIIIQNMFKILNSKYQNTYLVEYEDIVENAEERFRDISSFFDIYYQKGQFLFNEGKETNSFSLNYKNKNQNNRPFKYFSQQTVLKLNAIEYELKEFVNTNKS